MQTKNIDPTAKSVRVTYVKSAIGYTQKQKDTIKALGLHRLGETVIHTNTPEIRGMIDRVGHLLLAEAVN